MLGPRLGAQRLEARAARSSAEVWPPWLLPWQPQTWRSGVKSAPWCWHSCRLAAPLLKPRPNSWKFHQSWWQLHPWMPFDLPALPKRFSATAHGPKNLQHVQLAALPWRWGPVNCVEAHFVAPKPMAETHLPYCALQSRSPKNGWGTNHSCYGSHAVTKQKATVTRFFHPKPFNMSFLQVKGDKNQSPGASIAIAGVGSAAPVATTVLKSVWAPAPNFSHMSSMKREAKVPKY